jgi:hypothetical protein
MSSAGGRAPEAERERMAITRAGRPGLARPSTVCPLAGTPASVRDFRAGQPTDPLTILKVVIRQTFSQMAVIGRAGAHYFSDYVSSLYALRLLVMEQIKRKNEMLLVDSS